MLTELRVRDLAVIADVTLPLGPGLNVLTGETGAGKSMLVDALSLLLGERASSDLVRPGSDLAVVEAAFEPHHAAAVTALTAAADEAGIDLEDGRLVVRREIRRDGPNRAWANGSPTTVATLATLGRILVDLHGQHEAQTLLRPASQRDMLDAFGGAGAARERVRTAHEAATACREEEERLLARRDEIRARADYLRHVAKEIANAVPEPGEAEKLATDARRLAASEDLTRITDELVTVLDSDEFGVLERLSAADRLLGQLEKIDATVTSWRDLLDSAYAAADELARLVREYGTAIEQDPGRLAAVERRRDILYRLMQKYGATLDEVLETGAEAQRELDLLDTADLDIREIRERRDRAETELAETAAALTRKRTKTAAQLSAAVTRLLPGLGMPGGRFSATVNPAPAVAASGADTVTFMVQLNVGLDPRPLAQVASGGELSRLMLALKVVLARHDAVPTLVFDEVDQGIGGEVGAQLADALARVAEARQVLVISHLAPIAARASRHLRVVKRTAGGMTTAGVEVLEGAPRESEIARMLGSSDDRSLREHARRLLEQARSTAAPGPAARPRASPAPACLPTTDSRAGDSC